MSPESLKKRCAALSWTALGLALVFLLVAAWAGREKPATLVIYLLVASMELGAAAGGLSGVGKARDLQTLGEAQVLSSWWVLSVGFAGLLLFPSSFFSVAATPVALVICLAWIALGVYGLIVARKETGVSVSP